jgi:hypothetical protein
MGDGCRGHRVAGCQDERVPRHPDTVSAANHHPVTTSTANNHPSSISTPCFFAACLMRFLIVFTSSASYLAALSLWLI